MASRSAAEGSTPRPRPRAGACAVPAAAAVPADDALAALLAAAAEAGTPIYGRPAARQRLLDQLEQLAGAEIARAHPLVHGTRDEGGELSAYIGWDLDAPAS
ncbi:hypothetical protein [Pseudoxanthomonas sp. 10H]|uniref:hypothetical protein n=1 Tax=Pseudoxanthomonas sp. 10H TaxID=3242729 RepID=UPI003556A2B2